jgi:hypothetical protein
MERVEIVVNNDVLRRTASGNVYGNISLHLGCLRFPDPNWSYFVIVVLQWWCQAVLSLLQGERGSIEIRFIEGPFFVSIKAVETDLWHLSLVEDGAIRRVTGNADVPPAALLDSLLEATDRTIASCRKQKWLSSDIDQLSAIASAVRQEKKRLTV